MVKEKFDYSLTSSCLEPACGEGAMVHVLEDYFSKNLTYYDKDVDFLKEERKFDYIITNPPFSLASDFILKAKNVANKKFCMLLPLSYLHGKGRFDSIYSDREFFPLKKIHVFTRYPMLGDPLREDGKYRTGMMVYAWFVWEKDYRGEPSIGWIDNHKDVLKKGDL